METMIRSAVFRLRKLGYLDNSLEGREIHSLTIHPLTKEEALAAYCKSGSETWIWDELEHNMPYFTPKEGKLDVIIMKFNKLIEGHDALTEMEDLDVRPLSYEELIQYGALYPMHQDQKNLAALVEWDYPHGRICSPVLYRGRCGQRRMSIVSWDGGLDKNIYFPVVSK